MEQIVYIIIGIVAHIALSFLTIGMYTLAIHASEGKEDEAKRLVAYDFLISAFIVCLELSMWFINTTIAGTMTTLLIIKYLVVNVRKRREA